ncbi:hypothetical protein [Streptomyces sp. NPDC048002]|uniref:hypothetical protein n=1 Tax=Streptomyces sp. NPDC048002 TaxID=3154344 RepID=UPI0034046767
MSEVIEGKATRRGRTWVVHIPEHEVYGHGRTLRAAGENTAAGLRLVGVTAEVAITPVTPELERLRSDEDAYEAALSETVAALALRRTTLRDISVAVRVPTTRVKLLLAAGGTPPTTARDNEQDPQSSERAGPTRRDT